MTAGCRLPSLSRRAFVQALGAGAAGAWIGGRGLEGARFSLEALEAAAQNAGSASPLILSSNENPLGTPQPVLDAVRAALDQTGRPLPGRATSNRLAGTDCREAPRQARERADRLGLDAVAAHGDARVLLEDGGAGGRHPGLRRVRRLRGVDGLPGDRRQVRRRRSRWTSTRCWAHRRGRAWCSTATRTTRWPPRLAARRRATSSPRSHTSSPEHHGARRRGLLRIRHRSRLRDDGAARR